jgi:hypothetical protein
MFFAVREVLQNSGQAPEHLAAVRLASEGTKLQFLYAPVNTANALDTNDINA